MNYLKIKLSDGTEQIGAKDNAELNAAIKNEYLISAGKLIDPLQNVCEAKDLLVRNGKVAAVLPTGAGEGLLKEKKIAAIVDAKGLALAPGLVDIHTHLREPGFEYKETIATGTLSAVAGGFTSLACMANTNPVNDNPFVTKYIQAQIQSSAHCKVYPIGALSKGLKGEQLAEIGKMREAGIVAVSDDGMPVMNSYLMRKALDYCKAFGLTIISHAEDAALVGQGVMHEGYHSCCLGLRGIPAESEEIIVARDIALARLTGGAVHFAHVSARVSLEHIARAKKQGLKITAEVTPHHLHFCDEDISTYDSHFKMAPPLRTKEDVEAMRKALADGIIDCIATDHAPHAPRDKDVLFEFAANGVVGLETAWSAGLDLVNKGYFTLEKLVDVLAVRPAQIVGLPEATLKEGSQADFFLSHLGDSWSVNHKNLHSKSKNSPFLGKELVGQIVATFVDGGCRWKFSRN